jgi:hypothetical protein
MSKSKTDRINEAFEFVMSQGSEDALSKALETMDLEQTLENLATDTTALSLFVALSQGLAEWLGPIFRLVIDEDAMFTMMAICSSIYECGKRQGAK